jgi:hypothetical protein
MFTGMRQTAAGAACAFTIAFAAVGCGDDDDDGRSIPMGVSTAGTLSKGGPTPEAGEGGRSVAGASGRAGASTARGGGTLRAGGGGSAGTAGSAGEEEDAGMSTGGVGAGGASGSSGRGAGTAASGGARFSEVFALFTTNCAGLGCHVGAPQPGEVLAMPNQATAFMNLVGVASVACTGVQRVVPGDPNASLLVHALQHTIAGNCDITPQMPLGRPMLSASDIALVVAWIQAGAQND